MTELDEIMPRYIQIMTEMKALKEEKEALRTDLLIWLKTNDTTKIEENGIRAEYTINKRRSFDKERAIGFIQEKGGDANAFFTESDFETLKVKAIGGEQE